MPLSRRDFLKTTAAGLALWAGDLQASSPAPTPGQGPLVISTWRHGLAANEAAAATLANGGTALDAVEEGVLVSEADPDVSSVGYGGYPNAHGVVELDAAIMDGTNLEAGAVAGLQGIMHPVAVARKVMTDTPHLLLVGQGAQRFATANGHPIQDLLTPKAKAAWERWRQNQTTPADTHDTIGMVAMDASGAMAAACTTSGLAWKLPGRVGDSPLVGHGLYCDSAAGGAAATGVGEEVIKVAGSFLVVEMMRRGATPTEAIAEALSRILARTPGDRPGAAFVALRADGLFGYGSTTGGFQAAVWSQGANTLQDVSAHQG